MEFWRALEVGQVESGDAGAVLQRSARLGQQRWQHLWAQGWGGESWSGAVGEITAFMVVKQFSMFCLEVLTILTKKMASFPPPPPFFFLNTSNLAHPQALAGKAPHA